MGGGARCREIRWGPFRGDGIGRARDIFDSAVSLPVPQSFEASGPSSSSHAACVRACVRACGACVRCVEGVRGVCGGGVGEGRWRQAAGSLSEVSRQLKSG